jgi:hypothetical protein
MGSTTEARTTAPVAVEGRGVELLPLFEDPEAQAAGSGGGLGDLRLADVGRGFARYRPVLVTVLAIVVMAAVLPGPTVIGGGADDLWSTSDHDTLAGSGSVEVDEDEVGAADQPLAPTAAGTPAPDFGGTGGDFTSAAPRSPAADFSSSPSPTGPPAMAAAPPDPAVSGPSGGTDELRIVESGWATAAAGTPLGEAGVPEGALPVGKRASRDDKYSFLRLAGDGAVLQLTLAEGTGANRFATQADVIACAITDSGWMAEEGVSFDDAPPFDCDVSVPGVAAEDGTWTFDLSSLPDGAGEIGLALVPGPDAGVDFQVAFAAEEN